MFNYSSFISIMSKVDIINLPYEYLCIQWHSYSIVLLLCLAQRLYLGH